MTGSMISAAPRPANGQPPQPGSPAEVSTVIMAKSFDRAKTRFTTIDSGMRQRLAWSMLLDTVISVATTADRIVVVSDEPALAERLAGQGIRAVPSGAPVIVLRDPGHGLNEAVNAGDRALGPLTGGVRLAVVADLPALTTDEFAAVAAAAARQPASFVADADAIGTTMLATTSGRLLPRFGPGSALRHEADKIVALQGAWPGARRDVDTLADLELAATLGLGLHTRTVLAAVREILAPR